MHSRALFSIFLLHESSEGAVQYTSFYYHTLIFISPYRNLSSGLLERPANDQAKKAKPTRKRGERPNTVETKDGCLGNRRGKIYLNGRWNPTRCKHVAYKLRRVTVFLVKRDRYFLSYRSGVTTIDDLPTAATHAEFRGEVCVV